MRPAARADRNGRESFSGEARGLLRKDVATAVADVVKILDVKLTQSQFDALVDFAFNVGGGRRGLLDSTLLRTVNARGHVTERMFAEWDEAGKPPR